MVCPSIVMWPCVFLPFPPFFTFPASSSSSNPTLSRLDKLAWSSFTVLVRFSIWYEKSPCSFLVLLLSPLCTILTLMGECFSSVDDPELSFLASDFSLPLHEVFLGGLEGFITTGLFTSHTLGGSAIWPPGGSTISPPGGNPSFVKCPFFSECLCFCEELLELSPFKSNFGILEIGCDFEGLWVGLDDWGCDLDVCLSMSAWGNPSNHCSVLEVVSGLQTTSGEGVCFYKPQILHSEGSVVNKKYFLIKNFYKSSHNVYP